MKSRVSICLPTLNSMEFLAERLETIRVQSFKDWNLVAVDGLSDDGTYEALVEFAADFPGATVVQAERDGIYPNFNRSIRQADGEFVYIATSDDTMAPDCLEKMVAALDANPDCDIAHCPMRVIDEHGADGIDWWSGNSLFAQSSGDLVNRTHKRIAPLDGVLCMLGNNIYSSVTQLLIRRSLFDRIGFYQSDWGSVGDFHWNLRAGLVASTIHVPDTWGGWRMHSGQATAAVRLGSAEHRVRIDSMIGDVLQNLDRYVPSAGAREAIRRHGSAAAELRGFLRQHSDIEGGMERRTFLIREALSGKRVAWSYLASMMPGRGRWPGAAPESVGGWFTHPVLVPLS